MEKEKYWSRFADNFSELNSFVAGENNIKIIKNHLAEENASGQVLELGCGDGSYTQIIAESAKHVTATDLSPEMLSSAQKKFDKTTNISFERQNCHNLTYSDNTFDTVLFANLLHIVKEPEKVLSEAKRVLKPGGKLIIISFTMEGVPIYSKLSMIIRYLKTYGKPPKTAQRLSLKKAKDYTINADFKINKAELIGDNTKAIFISAQK